MTGTGATIFLLFCARVQGSDSSSSKAAGRGQRRGRNVSSCGPSLQIFLFMLVVVFQVFQVKLLVLLCPQKTLLL